MSHYRFIQEEKAAFPIATLCRVLEVGRSGYYAWARRGDLGARHRRCGADHADCRRARA